MYHKVIIIGNLGQDPEMHYTPEGIPLTTFSVATNRAWTNQDGSKGSEVIWWRISAWRKLAENCNEYLKKGRSVFIEGQMHPDKSGNPRTWQAQDGATRASYEVTASVARFLNSKEASEEAPSE